MKQYASSIKKVCVFHSHLHGTFAEVHVELYKAELRFPRSAWAL